MNIEARLRRVETMLEEAMPLNEVRAVEAFLRLERGGTDWADWQLHLGEYLPKGRKALFLSSPLVAALTARGERPNPHQYKCILEMVAIASHPPPVRLPADLAQFQRELEVKWRSAEDFRTRQWWALARLILGTDGGDRVRAWLWRQELGEWRIRRRVVVACAGTPVPWLDTCDMLPSTARRVIEKRQIGTTKTLVMQPDRRPGDRPQYRDSPVYGPSGCRSYLDAAVLLDLDRRCPWLTPRGYHAALRRPGPEPDGYEAFERAYLEMLVRRGRRGSKEVQNGPNAYEEPVCKKWEWGVQAGRTPMTAGR